MPTTNSYTIRSSPESSLLIVTNTTVDSDVGICYFDPTSESLLELSLLNGLSLTVQPYKKAIKKYYLVVNPTTSGINTVTINPTFINVPSGIVPTDYYSIKTIISATEPTLGNFDDLTNLNSFTITAPDAGSHTPIWILLENLKPLSSPLSISMVLNYTTPEA